MSREEFLDLFLDELRDIYDAEKQIVQGLPQMIQAASTPELRDAFQSHLNETKNQVKRLEKAFSLLKQNPSGSTCEAMRGLLEECEEIINQFPKSSTRDAGLIAAAQRVEHYEMAVYGTLRTFAKELDLDNIEDLLQNSLDEEGNANKKLTKIAEGGLFTVGINEKARGSV